MIFLLHWRRHGLGLLLAGAVALAVFSPNLWWNAANGWPTLGHTAEITVAAATPGSGKIASVAEFLAGQLLLLGPAGLVVALLLWRKRGQGSAARQSTPMQPVTFALLFAIPLLAVALAQSINARANMNWTAPALLGICLWLGLLAGPRLGRRALWVATLVGVLLPAGLSLASLSEAVRERGQIKSPHLDLWARMRGWQPALDSLQAKAVQAHLPVAVTERDLLVHARYVWRDQPLTVKAWPGSGRPRHHYEQFEPLWSAGQPPAAVLVLSQGEPTAAQRQAFAHWQRVDQARWGRLDLQLWRASQAP